MGNLHCFIDGYHAFNYEGHMAGTYLTKGANEKIAIFDCSNKTDKKHFTFSYGPVSSATAISVYGCSALPTASQTSINTTLMYSASGRTYDSETQIATATYNFRSNMNFIIILVADSPVSNQSNAEDCSSIPDPHWFDKDLDKFFPTPTTLNWVSFVNKRIVGQRRSGVTSYYTEPLTGVTLYYIPAETSDRTVDVVQADSTNLQFFTATFTGSDFTDISSVSWSTTSYTADGKTIRNNILIPANKVLLLTYNSGSSSSGSYTYYYYLGKEPYEVATPAYSLPDGWREGFVLHKFNGTSWD